MEKEMLKNKVAIITGASYGMGQTMAELFAEEGASVVLTARGREKLDDVVEGIRSQRRKSRRRSGGRLLHGGHSKSVCHRPSEFGDVDILINNAGIGEQKMIDETDDDWMRMVMDTNLGGPYAVHPGGVEDFFCRKMTA